MANSDTIAWMRWAASFVATVPSPSFALGMAVPEEMAIVGYDDIEFAAAAAVPLTSVRQPRQLIGRTAAEMVIAGRDGSAGNGRRHVVFSPELVVRESSRRLRRPIRTAPAVQPT